MTSELLWKKIEERLKFIYKSDYSEETVSKLKQVVQKYPKQENRGERWSEKDTVLITYGDSIKTPKEAPLKTLHQFLAQELKEQLSVIHILPFFPYSSDDGFSVINFRKVNPELGSWDDIANLTKDFDLMADLVINHASSQSEWFKNFLRQEGQGKDYFIEVDPSTDLSQVIRPRSTPLLTPYETVAGTKYVWTTFSADQIDLNFRNPDLLVEMMDILLEYVSRGARIIRLDAIAFLWKEIGTSCLHLPETHEVVKLMRDVVEYINPSGIILTETNVPNAENLSYFGKGDEAHMVYQFSLPPLLLHALHTGNGNYLTDWAQSLPELKANTTFFNFTASHDGIGVRPLEGLLPEPEKNALVESMKRFGGKVNDRLTPDGQRVPYELNITYFDALKGTHKGEDQWQVERFLASQTVMMSMAGIPAFYIHSLTATPNDYDGVKRTGQNRSINRKKWNLEELKALLSSETPQQKVFNQLRRLIQIRRQQKAFHPNASQKVLNLGAPVFCLERSTTQQSILFVVNLTDQQQTVEIPDQYKQATDLISGKTIEAGILAPYQCIWLETK